MPNPNHFMMILLDPITRDPFTLGQCNSQALSYMRCRRSRIRIEDRREELLPSASVIALSRSQLTATGATGPVAGLQDVGREEIYG